MTHQTNQAGAPQAGNGGVNRENPMKLYEAELKEARVWARIIGILYAISQFLAYCNLTWATVALLGAFLPSLHSLDFAFVTCLIFVEAGRLASASFFMRLLKRPLAYSSQDPKHIKHSADAHYSFSRRARFCSNVLQFILLAPSLVMPIIGHIFLNYDSSTRNLQMSLRIFYSMAAINSLVALVYLMCSALAFKRLNKPPEQSVLRYFDTVLERAMNCDLVQADDFELFQFAFTMLGGEFRRNVQPEAVAKNHKKLIQYMYAHRVGVDFLEIYLDADDAFVRLAAANMVGFWADKTWDVGVPELKLSEEILTKLADKVATGQVGWAATTSFGVLASNPKGAQIVARTRTSSGERLPARLASLVDDSSSRSLSLVRTLGGFYEQLCHVNEAEETIPKPFEEAEERLVEKLKKLARGAKVHRLRVQAAYLLLLMGIRLESKVVFAIDPRKDSYWYKSEVEMVELLRGNNIDDMADAHPLQFPPDRSPDEPFLREDACISPPPWAKRPTNPRPQV